MVALIAFAVATFTYGSRGADSGVLQFFLYGMVGFLPAAVCSWLAHEAIDFAPAPPAPVVEASK